MSEKLKKENDQIKSSQFWILSIKTAPQKNQNQLFMDQVILKLEKYYIYYSALFALYMWNAIKVWFFLAFFYFLFIIRRKLSPLLNSLWLKCFYGYSLLINWNTFKLEHRKVGFTFYSGFTVFNLMAFFH